MSKLYSFSIRSLKGDDIALECYRGKILLIVNTASECRFVSQYAGLQILYEQYAGYGFEILGFPCDQFGKQEPRDTQKINKFYQINYALKFQMFDKIDVNGINAHPLYCYLTRKVPGLFGTKAIKWNFTKFLVNREGKPIKRYGPITGSNVIMPDIKKLL
ncbi:glutathione peroxidase [Candidatus Vallotiella sp. (ex Adelges kitamiensis)]|uniref:glutathione peroxidase n=1 Tax=Candidatus Vallotiella sp. (ex Adelges kitamiensis) TaxID=2864217 RepID=UPI001CE3B0FA|nr:glutathione peroxidase [Candidatus Vallotia sp. (ex Adelges kitamiensis)]